jgi:hypothetical protein
MWVLPAGVLAVVIAVPRRHAMLSPQDFLRKTVKTRPVIEPGKIALQRIRIQRDDRSIERLVVKGAEKAEISGIAWEADLLSTPVDWVDPLSAAAFARWHAHIGKAKDSISESVELATLYTVPEIGFGVRSASLTVRKSDWRAVAERVEFEEGPDLEVRELSYELKTAPFVLQPAIAETSPDEVPVVAAAQRGADRWVQPARATPVALNQRGVLSAPPIAERPVAAQPVGIGSAGGDLGLGTPTPPAPAPLYATDPPLAQALAGQMGGVEAANHYMEQVRELYRRTMVDATALDQMAKQYTLNDWQRLPPETQNRITKMAMDMVAAIGENAASYSNEVALVLDPFVTQRGVSTPPIGGGGECVPWQASAARILDDLRGMQTAFRRLFVVDETPSPVSVTADELLRESAGRKAKLSQDVSEVCRPGTVNLVR